MKLKNGLKLIGLLACFSLLFAGAVAQDETPTPASEEQVNAIVVDIGVGGIDKEATGTDCFDYYKFGSVQFELLHADKHNYLPGETANFMTTIKNNNPYPLVEGNVIAQVYWLNLESGNTQGDNMIDEFAIMGGLSLDTNQAYPLAFDWKIPKKAPSGYYYVALFYQVKNSFNMAGLPFINNVYGASAGFTVEEGASRAPFYFDRNTVRLQGANQTLRNFSQSFPEGEDIEYAVSMKNPQEKKAGVYVEYRLFDWDQVREEQLLDTKKEFLEIEAESSADTSVMYSGLKPGAYLLQVYSEANGWYSILNLRFSVEGEEGRFIFSGIDKFPLEAGDEFTLFSCFSNSTDWFTEFDGKVEVELTANEKTIGEAEYSGTITPKIIAVAKDFTAGEEVDRALLTSRIYGSDGTLDQEITLEYDFRTFQTTKAYQKYFSTPIPTPTPAEEPTKTPLLESPKPKSQEQATDKVMIALIIAIVTVTLLILYFTNRGRGWLK